MPGLKERAKTLVELIDGARFLWASRPLALDDKAAALLTPEARDLIAATAAGAGGRRADWTAAGDRTAVRGLRRARGRQARRGRAAAARGADRPDHLARIFDVLAVLGRDESLARLRDQAGRHGLSARRSAAGHAYMAGSNCVALSCSAHLNGIPNSGPDRAPADAGLAVRLDRAWPPPIRGLDHGREDRRQDQDRQAHGRRQELGLPDLRRHDRSRRDRHRQALRRDRHVHLRPRLHLDRRAASPRSPTSTATKASCSIAAIRSSNSPSTATSSRPATCCSTANCRRRRRRPTSTTASRATPWCTSR